MFPELNVIYATEWIIIVVYKDREILPTCTELYSYQFLSLSLFFFRIFLHESNFHNLVRQKITCIALHLIPAVPYPMAGLGLWLQMNGAFHTNCLVLWEKVLQH